MKVFLWLALNGIVCGLFAQQKNFYYENAVFTDQIKTVQLYRDGFVLSNPVLQLGEDVRLVLKFDDLSGQRKDYYYTIIHCDADWNESFLSQPDYLDGLMENRIEDAEYSFNTTFKFVNYLLQLPNEKVRFKLSGNYVVIVYENGKKEQPVLTRRFYVVDNQTDINGTVKRATLDAFKGENQEIDFSVRYPRINIINPSSDVKVVIMQNNRWDNAIRNLKPLFIRDRELVYDYNRENVFPAGNEFRYFDIRTNKINGENILATDFHAPYYHKTLRTDEVRANKKYFQYKEMNGNYTVESQDRVVRDFDLECDYVFVHFTLPLEAPLLGGSVNVFGALSNWNCNKSNEMTWNFNRSAYELTMLLKQGYYNYQYVYVPLGSKTADHKNLEGSFWETENNYQIFVYYREMSGRYDRLIGYRQLNSVTDRY